MIVWIPAGWRKIQATAMALSVTLYFSASSLMTLLSSGNFSFPRKTPSNIPYWNGDHAWMVISFKRQYSRMPPSRLIAESLYIFALIPELIIGQCAILNCIWLMRSGSSRYLFNNSICIGVWLLTPKWRTLPAAFKVRNASATSSGSINVSGRCSNKMSR